MGAPPPTPISPLDTRKILMAMRTITLKLHNPGKRKREIMERAMLNYSRAYQYLLDKACKHIEDIRRDYKDARGNYRANLIAKWVDKGLSKELNRFDVQPFKDALKIDFGMTLASYLSLSEIQQHANYPIAYLSEEKWQAKYENAMARLTDEAQPLYECDRQIKRIIAKSTSVKPIFFCRYATNRDYCLLYDDKNDKYYAKLYLMNVKDQNRKAIPGQKDAELTYIHKESKVLESTGRKERFILLPLSFGRWQEKYLKQALHKSEMLKTARLIKKKNEYYLSVSIDIGEAEKVETTTYLGIARGLKSPVHYTAADQDSQVVDSGALLINGISGVQNRSYPLPVHEVHKLANTIVNIACRERSQVVMQALYDKGDKLQWKDQGNISYMPILSPYSYNELIRILEYKLTEKGLPAPIRVSPVGIFYTCPACRMHTGQNRFSRDLFICVTCGKTMDIEQLGSLNLARRLNQHHQGTVKVKLENTPKGVKFTNKILGLNYYANHSNHCMDEFWDEIERIIQDFRTNIEEHTKHKDFKKKYSLIKKLESAEDLNRLIQII